MRRLAPARRVEQPLLRWVLMVPLPAETRVVIIGAGFAGAATAWALGRLGVGPGLILEQETTYGLHASGRNAGLFRLVEEDPVVRALARRSQRLLRDLAGPNGGFVQRVGGLTLAPQEFVAAVVDRCHELRREGQPASLVAYSEAVLRWPFLADVEFQSALWCPEEGIVDTQGLLARYLQVARSCGFLLHTGSPVHDLIVAGGRVAGVRVWTREVRAKAVVDASGAWAGRIGRPDRPLPLQPYRRHLFTSSPLDRPWPPTAPFVWMASDEFYCRREGAGLLLSPCDQVAAPPEVPPVDPGAAELLAAKIARRAPHLQGVSLRRSWACLRTFASDRRPVVGPDPELAGLFHVSGLGGFGVTASAAIGELAASLIAGRRVDWIDPASVAPARLGGAPAS